MTTQQENSTHSNHQEESYNSAFRVTMVDGLRPLMTVNFLLGVSSYTITPSGHFQYPHKNFNRCRVLITLVVISVAAFASLYRMVETLLWEPKYETPDGFLRFNKMVELISRFLSNVCPLMLILVGLFKSDQLANFFREMGTYNAGVCEFAEPDVVKYTSRKIFVMHMIIMIVSVGLLYLRLFTALETTETIWLEAMEKHGIQHWTIMAISGCFVVALMLLKITSIAFLECFCVAMATCFRCVIENLSKFIEVQANKWELNYLDYPGHDRDSHFSEKSLSPQPLKQNKQLNLMNYPQPPSSQCRSDTKHAISHFSPGQQICFVIRKVESVSKMQTCANRLFGTILALNLGFAVFMVILLKYLLIRNLSEYLGRMRGTFLQPLMTNNYNSVKNVTTDASSGDLFMMSPHSWIFFLGFDICISLRILILTKYLSGVHTASLQLNQVLSKVLGIAQQLVQKIVTVNRLEHREQEYTGAGSYLSQATTITGDTHPNIINAIEANTVLAFLTVNSSQPIAFSAGGLLTFSESTILLIISVVISYIVFLLQAY